jgi:hypothetical protein
MAGTCRHCGGRLGGIGSSTSGTPVGHREDTCSSRPGAPKRPQESQRAVRGLGYFPPKPPTPRIKKIKSQNSSALSIAEQLLLLAQLRDSGALTEQEFESLKSQLISGA